jgi:hypothetical protein
VDARLSLYGVRDGAVEVAGHEAVWRLGLGSVSLRVGSWSGAEELDVGFGLWNLFSRPKNPPIVCVCWGTFG